MPKIRGGYFIKARQIKESYIAHSAPCVREIWDYLIREANHSDEKYDGFIIKRGQLFRNYKQIREDLSWFVGGRKEMYSASQVKHAMATIKKELMIATVKKPRGVLITVCNYDFFQDPKNYERTGNSERTTERPTNEPPTGPPNEPGYCDITIQNNNDYLTSVSSERTTERTTERPTNEPPCVHPLTRKKKQEKRNNELPSGNLSADSSANDSKPENCPHKKIISLYNETLGQVLPQCKVTNKTIEGNLRARWREDKTRQDLAWWSQFFNDVSESDFLMGRKGEWAADFTWLIRPTNMTKVINGNYKNRNQSPQPKPRVSDYSGDYSPEKMIF